MKIGPPVLDRAGMVRHVPVDLAATAAALAAERLAPPAGLVVPLQAAASVALVPVVPSRPFAPRDPGGLPPTGPETRRARAPVKGPLRKQTYDKPRGPIKQRPVSRLYDDEEDLEASVEFDDPAASRAARRCRR